MTKKEMERVVLEVKKMYEDIGEVPPSFVKKINDYLEKIPLPSQFYFWGLLAEEVPDALDFFNLSGEKPVTTIYIPPVLIKAAKIKAIIEDTSLSEVIRKSIIKWLKEDVERRGEGSVSGL